MLAVAAICAIACMFANVASMTIRCDYGTADIIAGHLPSGRLVHVKALRPNGEYETVAENVLVTANGRWEREKGSNRAAFGNNDFHRGPVNVAVIRLKLHK